MDDKNAKDLFRLLRLLALERADGRDPHISSASRMMLVSSLESAMLSENAYNTYILMIRLAMEESGASEQTVCEEVIAKALAHRFVGLEDRELMHMCLSPVALNTCRLHQSHKRI